MCFDVVCKSKVNISVKKIFWKMGYFSRESLFTLDWRKSCFWKWGWTKARKWGWKVRTDEKKCDWNKSELSGEEESDQNLA